MFRHQLNRNQTHGLRVLWFQPNNIKQQDKMRQCRVGGYTCVIVYVDYEWSSQTAGRTAKTQPTTTTEPAKITRPTLVLKFFLNKIHNRHCHNTVYSPYYTVHQSEWVIKFISLFRTVNIGIHIDGLVNSSALRWTWWSFDRLISTLGFPIFMISYDIF